MTLPLLDADRIRREFPVTQGRVFFDHACVAPLPARVREAIETFAADACLQGTANYSRWMQHVESVRASFARLIHAETPEVAFIKNTSEGISLVANGLDWREGDNVVVPDIEFPANVYPWLNLKRRGVATRFVKARDGRVLFEDIEAAVDARTRVLSISSVEYGSGFRNDLNRIGAFCKDKGILFCVDAIQSLGVLPMDVQRDHIDFLAADGHKWLLSVEGLGGFYIASRVMDQLHPAVVGWDSVVNAHDFSSHDFTLREDAKKFEEGSFNTLSIHAFGAALSLFHEVGMDAIAGRILHLGDKILEGLASRGIRVVSSQVREERSGSVVFSIAPERLDSFTAVMKSNQVFLSVRDGNVRLSPHFYNSEQEIDRFFAIVDRWLQAE